MVSLPAFPARATPRSSIVSPRPVHARATLRRAAGGVGGVERHGLFPARGRHGGRPRGWRLAARAVALRRDPLVGPEGTLLPDDAGPAVGPIILDLDLLLADRVAHRLGAGLDVLADADLLDHARLLGDDRLLAALAGLDHLLPEHGVARLDRAVHRPALDLDPLLAQ